MNREHLLRLVALPLTISVAGAAIARFVEFLAPEPLTGLEWSLFAAESLISPGCGALFAIAWHRRILLGERSDSWIRCHAWTSRHTPFFAWFFALALLLVSIANVSFPLTSSGGLMLLTGIGLAASYVAARLSVVLPSIAVGGTASARSAWLLSRGAGIRLFLVVALSGLAAGVILIPISLLLGALTLLGSPIDELTLPLRETQEFVVTAVEVSALSLAFERLRARSETPRCS